MRSPTPKTKEMIPTVVDAEPEWGWLIICAKRMMEGVQEYKLQVTPDAYRAMIQESDKLLTMEEKSEFCTGYYINVSEYNNAIFSIKAERIEAVRWYPPGTFKP